MSSPQKSDHELPAAHPRRRTVALLVIMGIGLALRAAYLVTALRSPGYAWEDPDGYMTQALRLAGPTGWQWTFDAVTYTINGQHHALPPLYSVFLSVFALFPGFPLSAQIGQVALAVAAIWLVFALGRRLHSPSAGLLAATAYALWVPNIFSVWSTSQESLYIPLILLGFVLLARAIDRDGGAGGFALAGLIFSAAAVTRSMPIFFAGPAALLHVALAPNRRRAMMQAAAFLAGFLVLTAPYTAALSRHFGQLTVIDTHGSIHFAEVAGTRTPGPLDTAAALWHTVASRPIGYLAECAERARTLLHVNGGRLLQLYVVAGSKASAAAWKVYVHLGSDVLIVLTSALSMLGAVACRRPRIAFMLLLWAAVNIGIASLGGFGGARLRTPFEPLLMVLAAVICSGQWQRPRAAALAFALIASIAMSYAVLPQVPRSLAAWPDYGIRWPSIFKREVGTFTGSAGFNVPAYEGLAAFAATPAGSEPVLVRVRVAGVEVRTERIPPGESTWLRALWPARGLAFVEITATDFNGRPAEVRILVPGT